MSRASECIENLSDQLEGYAQEVATTVKKISKQYDVTESFAMRITEAAINDMMMDIKHHKNYHLELIADSLQMIAESISDIAESSGGYND